MRIFTAFLLLCVACLTLQSCNKIFSFFSNHPQASYNPDENIVLFRPQLIDSLGTSRPMPVATQLQMIEAANVALRRAGSKDTIKIRSWCPCDSALVLLEGTNFNQLNISGREMASNTRPSGGVQGNPPFDNISIKNNTAGQPFLDWPQLAGDGSRNYIITMPDDPQNSEIDSSFNRYTVFNLPATPTEQPFIVAVMDTGIQPDIYPFIKGRAWINPQESPGADHDKDGLINDQNGWDFVNNTKDPYDSNGHGTIVTSLIHEQMYTQWAIDHVRYMFLKTYDKHGKATLFNNLCAMSYARQKGAKIINASWGFYSPQESTLLGYFLQELATSNVTVVAAAGNKDPNLEKVSFALGGVSNSYYRNLENNAFWPANYSLTHNNVITVTTIHPTPAAQNTRHQGSFFSGYEVCDDQNYSKLFANVGVFNYYGTLQTNCYVLDFTKIDFPQKLRITSGTSYAAPVVTGKIVVKLGQGWTTSNRDLLFKALAGATVPGQTNVTVLKSDAGLKNQINAGNYIFRFEP